MRLSALALCAVLFVAIGPVSAEGVRGAKTFVWTGSVQGYALSGVEPDGDPLYRVALQSRLVGGRLPPLNLIISAYLENFKPDTTPVLPDLLHPNQVAKDLGGFLEGKALLTDDAGNILYIGSFLTEAFLDNTNHTVIRFYGGSSGASAAGAGYAGGGQIKGHFVFGREANFTGLLQGTLDLPAAAVSDLQRHRGQKMKSLKDIIDAVTVTPHYYGTHGVHSSAPALHTGFGPTGSTTGSSSSGGRQLSPLTIIAGIGAAVSLLIAVALYIVERRRKVQSLES
jgi:hypothetical protein